MPNRSNQRFLNYVHRIWPYCQWCGRRLKREEATGDHVIPISQNGANSCFNKVISCIRCNNGKGASIAARKPMGPVWMKLDHRVIIITPEMLIEAERIADYMENCHDSPFDNRKKKKKKKRHCSYNF